MEKAETKQTWNQWVELLLNDPGKGKSYLLYEIESIQGGKRFDQEGKKISQNRLIKLFGLYKDNMSKLLKELREDSSVKTRIPKKILGIKGENISEMNFPNPVTSKKNFFGRKEELEKIQLSLLSNQKTPIFIRGERVVGKTSLLNITKEWIKAETDLVAIDLSHTFSLDIFMKEFVINIKNQIAKREGKQEVPKNLNSSGFETIAGCVGELEIIFSTKSDFPKCIFFLDELDGMLAHKNQEESGRILQFFHHLIENPELPFHFIFTLTQIPEEIRLSYSSPFLNSSQVVPLLPWEWEETRQYIHWLLQGYCNIDRKAEEEIFHFSGGSPYFTKAILASLLSQKQHEIGVTKITFKQIKETVQGLIPSIEMLPEKPWRFSEEVNFTLENIFQAQFSSEEKKVLGEIPLASFLSEKQIREKELSLKAARNLVKRELCRFERKNGFSYRLGFLGQWLENNPEVM